ncbi:MAG: sulfite exporter TauE/SafE family protein [Deltaproteobacteria bacterium]|nr:sulfite exporter TauE/SafE family protein [Deltaproteobacteria bacterium]
MEHVTIGAVALFVSALTLFSGFGLGTLLMPAFAFFLPLEAAVGATAIVHLANNIFKASVFVRSVDWGVFARFTLPAVLASFAGAALLGLMSGLVPIASYTLSGFHANITPLKIAMACLIAFFSLFELVPALSRLSFDRKWLPLGGVLSGFFGGISGHQGALRSAFLTKVGLSPTAFVGVNSASALLVDVARLSVYGALTLSGQLAMVTLDGVWSLIVVATICAFAGVVVGRRMLKKVTMRAVQLVTGVLLVVVSLLLGAGLI